jgi:hypothetical protein
MNSDAKRAKIQRRGNGVNRWVAGSSPTRGGRSHDATLLGSFSDGTVEVRVGDWLPLRVSAARLQADPLRVIVTGFERGGTTLLASLIRQHPSLDGRFECGFLRAGSPRKFLTRDSCHNYRVMISDWGITPADLAYICGAGNWREMYRRLLERSNLPDKNVGLVDKTPAYMQCLDQVLAKTSARCVAIIRDPRAVFWSRRKRSDRHTVPAFAEYYLGYMRGLERALAKFPGRVHVVQYEQFCETPDVEAKQTYRFLGLEWREEYLAMDRGPRYENVYGGAVSREYVDVFTTRLDAMTQERILRLTRELFNGR